MSVTKEKFVQRRREDYERTFDYDMIYRHAAELAWQVYQYESAITWDTTCLQCASLLDASIEAYEEGYHAAENSAAVRALNRLTATDES